MIRIGFVGMGKLGYPVATAIAYRGHEVLGYDIVDDVLSYQPRPYQETGPDRSKDFNAWFDRGNVLSERNNKPLHEILNFTSQIGDLASCDMIFVAVQTPHDPRFEGVTPLTEERADFDYTYLEQALAALSEVIDMATPVVIISTCLPGTVRAITKRHCSPLMKVCYNPFFIAMGTTMNDFLNPEFVLIGEDDKATADELEAFYGTLHDAPIKRMSIESAELTKVAYNTYIGMKIVFANTLMEICRGFPRADVDDVTDALKCARRRLISSAYMDAGMGDGGGCHPRDNIAMSWLAREMGLSCNFFDDLMLAREHQTAWFVEEIASVSQREALPIIILGEAFKPETNLTTGSPALLLSHLLWGAGIEHQTIDWHVRDYQDLRLHKAVYFIGTRHADFASVEFPAGSIVLDPWRYIPHSDNCEVIHIGAAEE